MKKTQKKIGVVYTCFSAGYDDLLQHAYVDSDFDYVCFTDDKKLIAQEKIGHWQIRPLIFNRLDDARNIRWHKILPHRIFPEYKLSIWLDANIDVLSPKVFAYVNDKTLQFPAHHVRNCIYDECLRVLETKKDTYENVIKVAEFLVQENMPKNYGMNEANIIIRQHNDAKVKKIMNDWWHMVKNYSHRDQLSLSYVLWKNGMQPNEIAFQNARNDADNFYFALHNNEDKKCD